MYITKCRNGINFVLIASQFVHLITRSVWLVERWNRRGRPESDFPSLAYLE